MKYLVVPYEQEAMQKYCVVEANDIRDASIQAQVIFGEEFYFLVSCIAIENIRDLGHLSDILGLKNSIKPQS